jgi:DNA-binding transcriptional ArsR family regulator
MKTMFVEHDESGQKFYESLVLEPKHLGIFSSGLAVKIISELAKQPMCAMDLGKKLKENEQKIYYHLRKMRKAGIVRLSSTEARYGMTAKLFALVSPVIAAKLYEAGYETKSHAKIRDPDTEKFLDPFVKDGKLNATIIFGDGRPHGKYEGAAHDGAFTADLMLFLGNNLSNHTDSQSYKLDTFVREDDLKNNLIVIGGPRINTVAEKINSILPVKFNTKTWDIVSALSNKTYSDESVGLVVKCDNPFNKKKKILFLGGKKSRGTIVSVIAVTQHIKEILDGNANNSDVIAKVAKGVDKDGDGFIDSIRFLE